MHAVLSRVAAASVLAAVVTAVSAVPAFADGGQADGWVDSQAGAIGAGARSGGQSDGSGGGRRGSGGGGGGGGVVSCTYTKVDQQTSVMADNMASSGFGEPRGSGPGAWYRKMCTDGTGNVVWGGAAAAPVIDPAALARQAFDQTKVPLPAARFNPSPPQDLIVNLATWLWVDNYAPVRASASAGPVTVTVTAAPSGVRWAMGNGDAITRGNRGTAYDKNRPPESQRTDCSYTYRRSSAAAPNERFTVSTTVTWHVTWTASGVAASGDLGNLSRTTSTQVRVAEIQAVHQ
jgi:hypothetical protein